MKRQLELGDSFLSFTIPPEEFWRPVWSSRLKAAGVSLSIDASSSACLLLVAADLALQEAAPNAVSLVASAVRAPERARSGRAHLHRWVVDHWHKAGVRQEMGKILGEPWWRQRGKHLVDVPSIAEQIQVHLLESGRPRMAWAIYAWLACGNEDTQDAARGAYGPDAWDQYAQELEQQVAPVLYYLAMKVEIERLDEQERGKGQINNLSRQVRALTWTAQNAQEKHERATSKVALLENRVVDLEDEVTQLLQKLAARDARLAQMQEEFAAERRAWAELVCAVPERTEVMPGHAAAAPLLGKRVVVVGGDPMAASGTALIQTLGAREVIWCPGYDEKARVAEVARTADVVVAVTEYMSHSHTRQLKGVRKDVIWIRMGLSALRRALCEPCTLMQTGGAMA